MTSPRITPVHDDTGRALYLVEFADALGIDQQFHLSRGDAWRFLREWEQELNYRLDVELLEAQRAVLGTVQAMTGL